MGLDLEKFLFENKVSLKNLSNTVQKTLTSISSLNEISGGFLRNLVSQKTGGSSTILPSEYFGSVSKSYHSSAQSTNISDATPTLTKPPLKSTFKGGSSTILPTEYFGVSSKSYLTNVQHTNVGDASPKFTRPALNFKGGGTQNTYNFCKVDDLKCLKSDANKYDKRAINIALSQILPLSINNKNITMKSLRKAFSN